MTGLIARPSTGVVRPPTTAMLRPAADGMPTSPLMVEFRLKMPAVQPDAPGTENELSTSIAVPETGLYGMPVIALPELFTLRPVIRFMWIGLDAEPIEHDEASWLPTLPLSLIRARTSSTVAPVSGSRVPVAASVAITSALTIHRPLKLMPT